MSTTKKVTVIIADADNEFANSLETLLTENNYEVIDKIPKRHPLVLAIPLQNPDIVIIDYNLSTQIEGDAIIDIRHKYPMQKLFMLTYFANLDVFEFCMMYSVNGFQVKDCSKQELLEALDTVMSGGFALPMPHKSDAETQAEKPPVLNAMGRKLKLTLREMQIIKLLMEGHTNSEIAKTLYRTEEAIDEYCNSIFEKVGVNQLTHLLAFASNSLF